MGNQDTLELHIKIEAEASAIDSLSQACDLSRTQLKQAMQCGAVWLSRNQHSQRVRRGKKGLHPGDELHLYYNPDVLAQQSPHAQLIADEGEFSVWYKPYGMHSQGSKWGDHTTIYRWAEQHLEPQRNAFLVHRLDRAASGLILLAHSKTMAAKLAELFQQRRIGKSYYVIVHGKPEQQVFTIDTELDGKQAVSHIHLLQYDSAGKRSLLEVKIDTGRKHQIRRHLAAQGLPVVGDRLYGESRDEVDLQLAAVALEFEMPPGRQRMYLLEPSLRPAL
jgi:tRNA pseudouridine32 synthase/23S rRNA pseudouridine746 synthase